MSMPGKKKRFWEIGRFLCLLAGAIFMSGCRGACPCADPPPYPSALARQKAEAIQRLLSAAAQRGDFSGAALVAEEGWIIYRNAFGLADTGKGEAFTPLHVFGLGTASETFTALAVLKLQEQGRLQVNDAAQHYLPGFPYENLTIEHLLSHTSGLSDGADQPAASGREVLERLRAQRPALGFQPGERFVHCRSGYELLAAIIERVSGKTYDDFLRHTVFTPAAMNRTFVRDGEVCSTVDDLFTLHRVLRSGRLLPAETQEKAYSPYILNGGEKSVAGYGWFVRATGDSPRAVWFGGQGGEYRVGYYREIDRDNVIVLLTDARRPPENLEALTRALVDILHGGDIDDSQPRVL